MKAPVERYEQQLLEALRAFLRREPACVLLRESEEWAQFWALTAQQKVLPMAADALAPGLGAGGGDSAFAAVRRIKLRLCGGAPHQIPPLEMLVVCE